MTLHWSGIMLGPYRGDGCLVESTEYGEIETHLQKSSERVKQVSAVPSEKQSCSSAVHASASPCDLRDAIGLPDKRLHLKKAGDACIDG